MLTNKIKSPKENKKTGTEQAQNSKQVRGRIGCHRGVSILC